MKIGTPAEEHSLLVVVLAISILNVIDGVLTVFWVINGRAVEANLFLKGIVHGHPATFIIVKMSLVLLGTVLLWLLRKKPAAVISLFIAFLLYYYVVLYHLGELDVAVIRHLASTPLEPLPPLPPAP
ncbi:MAG: DUF5658 family protein [Myxococcota bacterium]